MRDWRRRNLAVLFLPETSILLNHRLNYIGGIAGPSSVEIAPPSAWIEKSRRGIDFMVIVCQIVILRKEFLGILVTNEQRLLRRFILGRLYWISPSRTWRLIAIWRLFSRQLDPL